MALTTYLSSEECRVGRTYPYELEDLELADLLKELRERTGRDWIILRHSSPLLGSAFFYCKLYLGLGCGEFQVLQIDSPKSYILGALAMLDTLDKQKLNQ